MLFCASECTTVRLFSRALTSYLDWFRGGAFPQNGAAVETKCVVDKSRRVAACGDFCISPRVESAMLSGLTAAHEIRELLGEEGKRGIRES